MTSLRHAVVGVLAVAALATSVARAADGGLSVTPDTQVVPPDELARQAAVRDVKIDDGTVSGTAVNTSSVPLRDVKLLVRYGWLWKNERRPGANSPGRIAWVTLPGELRPGESQPFTAPAESPPRRSDGRFVPSVEVAGVVDVGGSGSATAGRR
jgi:hypothetical protein